MRLYAIMENIAHVSKAARQYSMKNIDDLLDTYKNMTSFITMYCTPFAEIWVTVSNPFHWLL